MIRRGSPSLVGILLLSLVSVVFSEGGCGEASKADSRELRGSLSQDCGQAVSQADPEEDDNNKSKGKDQKNQKMKIDETGSPTNNDIEKVEKAVKHKVGSVGHKIYTMPLHVRLSIVAIILAFPLAVITALVYFTPAERHAESVYIKTAVHCGFSFTVGWLNCIMLLRYRVFATMMVGNTILMGVAFVCNGGFTTAQEEDYTDYWWLGKKARVLCPAQFENASKYMAMILLFILGAFLQGVLHRKFQWSSRAFAPIIAAGIIGVEMLEYFQVFGEAWADVYMLSPIFGMFVSISAHCGVGSVPWAATGHMTSMSYKFASWCVGGSTSYPDLSAAMVNLSVWLSFVLGIMMGTLFHSNRTVMMNALYLQGMLIANGVIYKSPKENSLDDADVNGIEDVQLGDTGKRQQSYASCERGA